LNQLLVEASVNFKEHARSLADKKKNSPDLQKAEEKLVAAAYATPVSASNDDDEVPKKKKTSKRKIAVAAVDSDSESD